MADTTTIEAAANGAPAKETPPVKQQVECSTLEQFLDKFVKDELCDLDLEDLKEEDKISPEEFLKGQTDVRIVDGKLKDGVLTTADWDLLASRVPECNALEFCNCGLTKIEAPSENNPLKKTINVVVIGDNEGLTSLDFVKHFAEINTFCVDQVPLLKTKEDIEIVFKQPALRVLELSNGFNRASLDKNGEPNRTLPIFGFESEEEFRKYCFDKNPEFTVVNGLMSDGTAVPDEFLSSDEEEEEEGSDLDLDDLEGLSEEQINALLAGGELDSEEEEDEEEDKEDASAEPDSKRQKTE